MFNVLTESLEKLEMTQTLSEAFENILLDEADDILDDIIDLDDDDLDAVDLDDLDDDDIEDEILGESEVPDLQEIDIELSEDTILDFFDI